MPIVRIVDATIKAIIQSTEGVRLQVDFGKDEHDDAALYLWRFPRVTHLRLPEVTHRRENREVLTDTLVLLLCGDHGSPCQMPERNPVAFAAVGSVPIHELAPVNELVEIRIVRPVAGEIVITGESLRISNI